MNGYPSFYPRIALVAPTPEGQNCPIMKKISRNKDTHNVSVYQIWGLSMIFKAMNADKWLWPNFGCKVGQNVPIGMKLELDL